MLGLVKGEAQGCKDVACLMEASMVLCHLAGLHADVSRPALQALLVLLCNRFPKVLPLPNRLFSLFVQTKWGNTFAK